MKWLNVIYHSQLKTLLTVSEKRTLNIYSLNSLNLDDIRFYAAQRQVDNTTEFVDGIERANLQAMASRPFDLDFLISTWSQERKFDLASSCLNEMLQHGSMKSILQGVRQDHLRQQKRLRGRSSCRCRNFHRKKWH